jgi:hypothetical protein
MYRYDDTQSFSPTMKAPQTGISRQALPVLKPCSPRSDSPEKPVAKDPLDEICDLRHQLLLEKSKHMELRQQIAEMRRFFADYGIKWAPQIHSKDGPDPAIFPQKIQNLNRLFDPPRSQFAQTCILSAVKRPQKVELGLHAHGFTLDSGDLREYDDPQNAAFIQNLMNGVLPTELKARYPEGIQFVLSDYRETFKGQARRLDERRPSSHLDMLSLPVDIGTGDGLLKLRLPSFPDVTVRVTKEMMIGELMDLIETTYDIHQFQICSPVAPAGFDRDATLGSVGLYPRGLALVVFD